MTKLQFNSKQYTITIPEDLIKKMKWKKREKLFISKNHNENFLYIEKMRQ